MLKKLFFCILELLEKLLILPLGFEPNPKGYPNQELAATEPILTDPSSIEWMIYYSTIQDSIQVE